MKYGLGKIGLSEGVGLVTVLLLPRNYLMEPSLVIGFTGSAVWLMTILSGGMMLAAFLLLLFSYRWYCEKYCGGEMIEYLEFLTATLGGGAAKLLYLAWAAMICINAGLILRQFGENILITALPYTDLVVVLVLLTAAGWAGVYAGLEILTRVSFIFYVISLAALALLVLMLTNLFDWTSLYPWQGFGLAAVGTYACKGFGAWGMLLVLLVAAPALQNFHTVRKTALYGVGICVLMKIVLYGAIILVFGVILGADKTLPFYDLARQVMVSRYIQRLESLFIIVWVLKALLAQAVTSYFALMMFAQTFRMPTPRPLIPLFGVLVIALALLPRDYINVTEIDITYLYAVSTYFYLGLVAWIGAACFWKSRRKPPCSDTHC